MAGQGAAAAAKQRGVKRPPAQAAMPPIEEDAALKALLAAHNKRFKTQHTYVPSLGIRETRKVRACVLGCGLR
jgi:hypothetical protein